MRRALPREGQPVLFLGLLLAGWCLVRVLTWSNPLPSPSLLAKPLLLAGAELVRATKGRSSTENRTAVSAVRSPTDFPVTGSKPTPLQLPWKIAATAIPPSRNARSFFAVDRHAMGHHLLFAAGMASMPMPRSLAPLMEKPAPSASPILGEGLTPQRWRMDGWLVLRPGNGLNAEGGIRPASYGGSQIGAVAAFRLAPGSSSSPSAYVRASKALVQDGEREVSAGVALRPLRGLPVAVHAEARVTDRIGAKAEVRPAVFLVSGADDIALPKGVTARYYAQAGYVGGRFATGFADGAVVAERQLARSDFGNVAIGAGVWGGAQRGAARLDIGPSVTARVSLGDIAARVEADYRWRVAGQAQPGNGGVLTLSTGF